MVLKTKAFNAINLRLNEFAPNSSSASEYYSQGPKSPRCQYIGIILKISEEQPSFELHLFYNT